jgi:hypothetical protein
VTEAVRVLREREAVLSLPVYDPLIVPASKAAVSSWRASMGARVHAVGEHLGGGPWAGQKVCWPGAPKILL